MNGELCHCFGQPTQWHHGVCNEGAMYFAIDAQSEQECPNSNLAPSNRYEPRASQAAQTKPGDSRRGSNSPAYRLPVPGASAWRPRLNLPSGADLQAKAFRSSSRLFGIAVR